MVFLKYISKCRLVSDLEAEYWKRRIYTRISIYKSAYRHISKVAIVAILAISIIEQRVIANFASFANFITSIYLVVAISPSTSSYLVMSEV